MSLLSFLFPKYASRKEASEAKKAAYERYREEEIDNMVRVLMNPGRKRR